MLNFNHEEDKFKMICYMYSDLQLVLLFLHLLAVLSHLLDPAQKKCISDTFHTHRWQSYKT